MLGFVALSARDNPDLIETTSREGFQVTLHYENFFDLLSEFVRFAGDVQEFLRRGVLQFLGEHRDRGAAVEPEDTHSTITQRIDDVAGTLSSEKNKLHRHAGSLRRAATNASKTLGQVRNELEAAILEEESVSKALGRLDEAIEDVSVTAANAEKMLGEVSTTLERASESL